MKRAVFLLALVFLSAPAHAAAPAIKNPQTGISADPALAKAEEAYRQAIKAVSPVQRQKLAALDQAALMAEQPQAELTTKSIELAACAKLDPTLQAAYGKKIQNFSMAKLDEMREGWTLLASRQEKIDFIDQRVLSGHIAYDRSLQTQMTAGVGEGLAQQIVATKNASKCSELKADLNAKYAEDYTVPAKQSPPEVKILRNKDDHSVEACITGINHTTGDGAFINVALIYAHYPQEASPVLEFNARVKDKDGKPMKVQDVWVNFGAIDTRFASRMMQPSPDFLVGRVQPPDLILPLLDYMKSRKVVAAVKAGGWPKQVAFEAGLFPANIVGRMASCVAAVNPSLADPLKKAGFTPATGDLQ
jgi:hypothetical protein